MKNIRKEDLLTCQEDVFNTLLVKSTIIFKSNIKKV